MVVGAAPGELHDVGALMFGVFLRRRGIRTLFLGAAVPVDAAVDVARRLQPRVLSLAAATAAAAAEVRAVSLALDGLAPPRPRFAFGGRAFDEDPALIEGIQGVYLGPDLRAAAETVEALLLEPRERSLR